MSILKKYLSLQGEPIDKEAMHIAPLTGICTPEEFFKKYADADSTSMMRLKQDLHNVLNDILWIKEAGFENTAWAIDFVDSLNTLSGQL